MFKTEKIKIGFVCANGLETFIKPIIEDLQEIYECTLYLIGNESMIREAIVDNDLVWFEWANEAAVFGTLHMGNTYKPKKCIVRLHRYEAYIDSPSKLTYENINKMIFIAPHIFSMVKENVPALGEKGKLIYNGVSDNLLQEFATREPGYNIGMVCYIDLKKNVPLALQIMYNLPPQHTLTVAGRFQDKALQTYLEYMVKEMGLEKQVKFLGYLKPEDMTIFWADKQYCLSTSIMEGHPYNIMEACVRGIRPIIHDFPGSTELYPRSWLYDTVDEAMDLILTGGYNSEEYRDYIINHRWLQTDMMAEIRQTIIEVLNG